VAEWFLLLEKKSLPAAENMARDEYLFNVCHEKKIGFLRLYSWENPSFSFGVSQKIAKTINIDFININNCSYVRRITGGKTVLHNDEITYAIISSEDIFYKDNDLYQSYRLISNVLVNAFKAIGIDVYLSKGRHSPFSKSRTIKLYCSMVRFPYPWITSSTPMVPIPEPILSNRT
jgi:lipoate-protein ligase A